MLTVAHMVLHPRAEILSGELLEDCVAKCKVAIDFSRAPKHFQLRALMEEWDAYRIVRELY